MPHATWRIALRSAAVLISAASFVDPALTLDRAVSRKVVVVRLLSSDASAEEDALRAALAGAEVLVRPAAGRRLPCAPDESCILIADGSVDLDLPDDARVPVSLIAVDRSAPPNVALRSAAATVAQYAAATGSVRVELNGLGVAGRRTEIRVTDGAAMVGSQVHEWTSDGDAAIDVNWWPVADGPRTLRIEAAPAEGESSAIDNIIDVGVVVSDTRLPVLIFDPRPSWSSTFIRRALEDDPRFQVDHRARLGPSVAAGTAAGRLDSATLDSVPVVFVGAPDALASSEVDLLERFVRVRGGTLIVVPDRAPAGAGMRLFPGRWTEQLEVSPVTVGPLSATEILRSNDVSSADLVLGTANGAPSVILSPTGHGRIVVSGAMDAWRYRDLDENRFDRFWRSLAAEGGAEGAALRLQFDRDLTAPGSAVAVGVRYRRMDNPPSTTLGAVIRCGDAPGRPLRLWPTGPSGVFAGRVTVDEARRCQVEVTTDGGPSVAGGFAVTPAPIRGVSPTLAKLEQFAIGTNGAVVRPGQQATVAARLARSDLPPGSPSPFHPMRSPWWVLPFAGCLAAEWWLRRRSGLR